MYLHAYNIVVAHTLSIKFLKESLKTKFFFVCSIYNLWKKIKVKPSNYTQDLFEN